MINKKLKEVLNVRILSFPFNSPAFKEGKPMIESDINAIKGIWDKIFLLSNA